MLGLKLIHVSKMAPDVFEPTYISKKEYHGLLLLYKAIQPAKFYSMSQM